jgi:hypothetical protein
MPPVRTDRNSEDNEANEDAEGEFVKSRLGLALVRRRKKR